MKKEGPQPSLANQDVVSIVQQIPMDLYKYLLEFLDEKSKYLLWRYCCHYLRFATEGTFIRPINPPKEFRYYNDKNENDNSDDEDEDISISTQQMTIPRLGQKYRKLCFERLNDEQIICAYPHGILSILSLSTELEVASQECQHPITQLFVLNPHLILCHDEGKTVSLYTIDDNKITLHLSLSSTLTAIIAAIQMNENEIMIATNHHLYLLHRGERSLIVKFSSENPIIGLNRNIGERLIITIIKSDLYQNIIYDPKEGKERGRYFSKNCDRSYRLDPLVHVNFNSAGNPNSFFKSNTINMLSVYYARDDAIFSIIPAVSENNQVLLLNNGDLLFLKKEDPDQFEITVKQYPTLSHD